jgi:hypothetical protein
LEGDPAAALSQPATEISGKGVPTATGMGPPSGDRGRGQMSNNTNAASSSKPNHGNPWLELDFFGSIDMASFVFDSVSGQTTCLSSLAFYSSAAPASRPI